MVSSGRAALATIQERAQVLGVASFQSRLGSAREFGLEDKIGSTCSARETDVTVSYHSVIRGSHLIVSEVKGVSTALMSVMKRSAAPLSGQTSPRKTWFVGIRVLERGNW